MTAVLALWLPILLSAVIVFVVSSVIHMLSPWHKGDYPKMPNEDRLMAALRPFAIPPGDYMIPRPATRQEMSSPEFLEKMKQGPVVVMTVMKGSMDMAPRFIGWFLYAVVVGVFAAAVAGSALPPGSPYLHVFHYVALVAFVGYSLALWQLSIWYGRSWMITFKSTVDGLIYALLTAGTFGWLWPH